MTIAAKANAGITRLDVALITEIAVVTMPGPVAIETRQSRRMDARIGSSDTVGIVMTAAAGAGGIIGIVAGGAVFDIIPSRSAMLGQPSGGGMQQRNAVFAFMAVIAE